MNSVHASSSNLPVPWSEAAPRIDAGSLPALDHAKWIAHFLRNRMNRPEPDWAGPTVLRAEVLPALRRSLEQFQLGDGGGPASLIAHDAERFRGSTPEMQTLVDLWFAEEREHARLLGCAVDRFNGRRIQSHWSFTAFCQCRRWLGVRFELQVLLLTEIVSTAYYRLLRRHGQDTALRGMCALILRDEGGHVAFHRARLRASGRSTRGWRGMVWAVQFCSLGLAAATMLWVNHAPCLKALGGTGDEFYGEVILELRRFLVRLNRTNSSSARVSLEVS